MATGIRVSGLGNEGNKARDRIQAALNSLHQKVDSAQESYDAIKGQVKQNITMLFHELAYHEELFALLAQPVNVLGNRRVQGIFLAMGEIGLILSKNENKITVYLSEGLSALSDCQGEVQVDDLVQSYGDTEILEALVTRVRDRAEEFNRVTDGNGRWQQTLENLCRGLFTASK